MNNKEAISISILSIIIYIAFFDILLLSEINRVPAIAIATISSPFIVFSVYKMYNKSMQDAKRLQEEKKVVDKQNKKDYI